MKQLAILITAIVFGNPSLAQRANIETSFQTMNLKGRVLKIIEKEYELKLENDQPQKGALKYIFTYNFDTLGNLISKVEVSVKPTSNTTQSINYKYAKPGLLAEKTLLKDDNQIIVREEMKYDTKDFRTSWIKYDATGKIIFDVKSKYEFTSSTDYTRTETENGKTYTTSVILNNSNKIISEKSLDASIDNITHTYNTNNQLISTLSENVKSIKKTEFFYEYDEAGNRIKETMKSTKGNPPKTSINVTSINYIYDAKSNWTTCITQSQLVYINSFIERELTYFYTNSPTPRSKERTNTGEKQRTR
jgi:hypothetical protein